ncbi:Putative alcohol dehydrogenase, zinc-type, GroES-like superfamily [Septoria linicola]|uniref:Alcohol dehydrogenase, zinc-type, GroES-like superfamily n=1 Tax=Septoria linicola TaxID=215465 RepID=A0A9Q9EGH7_9PEZI|nr:putative alcohol dehydrogenase, zinc-type, GroES-like superfamily [Septoria linicola]USW49995.1 Putative alcohol dehydrogenase, zinc-type, GroES-like superfamily [Septoria linicola]
MVVCGENGLGHESAGSVIAVGSNVTNFKPGDRVALECGIPCSKPSRDFCRTSQYNACPQVVFFSTPPYHGTLRRYHVHPAAWLHRLPDNLSFEEGSLLEPLSVALAGIDRSNLRLGDPLLICGAGPIGLVSLLAAHAAGLLRVQHLSLSPTLMRAGLSAHENVSLVFARCWWESRAQPKT